METMGAMEDMLSVMMPFVHGFLFGMHLVNFP
jgi:hypothetical protein